MAVELIPQIIDKPLTQLRRNIAMGHGNSAAEGVHNQKTSTEKYKHKDGGVVFLKPASMHIVRRCQERF